MDFSIVPADSKGVFCIVHFFHCSPRCISLRPLQHSLCSVLHMQDSSLVSSKYHQFPKSGPVDEKFGLARRLIKVFFFLSSTSDDEVGLCLPFPFKASLAIEYQALQLY